jgi:hypothetical protein
VKALKDFEVLNGHQFNESANAVTEGRSPATVARMQEARAKRAERDGAKAALRAYRVQGENLEAKFQAKLKELRETWYNDLLEKQVKVIRKVAKAYVEKRRAAETVLQ